MCKRISANVKHNVEARGKAATSFVPTKFSLEPAQTNDGEYVWEVCATFQDRNDTTQTFTVSSDEMMKWISPKETGELLRIFKEEENKPPLFCQCERCTFPIICVCSACHRGLCKEHVVQSVFSIGFNVDIDIRVLPLPLLSCVLCRAQNALPSWPAVPNGTKCFLTVDSLCNSLDSPVDETLKHALRASVQNPPSDIIDGVGILVLYEQVKNITFNKLTGTIRKLIKEAESLGVPPHVDMLVLDLIAHQDGKDLFVFERDTIAAPTVLKQMLDGCSKFWELAPKNQLHSTIVILWSCVSNVDAITQLLTNMPSFVLLCFRGAINIQSTLITTRQHLMTEITMRAPKNPQEVAAWLAQTIKVSCSQLSIAECKPAVITHDKQMYVNK